MIASSVSPQARMTPNLAPRKRIRHLPADVKRATSPEWVGRNLDRAPTHRVSLCLMPGDRRPSRQPSSTAPVYGAIVRLLTWVPVGVVMVLPRFTVTDDEEGFTSTRPLVNERWYTPPNRY